MTATPVEDFQKAVDLVAKYGSIASAACAVNLPSTTLRDRYKKAIEKGFEPNRGLLEDARRVNYDVPMSEDEGRYHSEWSPRDCINELRRIANIDPERVISRNYFRVHSKISESTWTRYFGTFEEYKKQAGITPSRHARMMERAVGKHASVDAMRQMNKEKAGYEEAYLKPSGKRFKTAVGFSDIHDVECDPFYRYMAVEAVKRIQPDKIILAGDIMDLYEFGSYTKDPRDWDVIGRIQWVHKFIGDLREASPDSEMTYLEGNHEHRLLRHLSEATPALKVVLSELHGFNISSLLGLDKFELNYIGRMDLGTFRKADIGQELKKNWIMVDGCFLVSHYPQDRNMQVPGFAGHHHKHLVWNVNGPTFGSGEFHQLGAGHSEQCTYADGSKWNQGFIVAHYDIQELRTQFEYVDVSNQHCVLGGKWYSRDEMLTSEESK